MACNCNKTDRRAVWKRHLQGHNANIIAAQLMVQLNLVKECIERGDPDIVATVPFGKTKKKNIK